MDGSSSTKAYEDATPPAARLPRRGPFTEYPRMAAQSSDAGFQRNIGLFLAVMIGIGAMMGPGVFALPSELAHLVGPLGVLVYIVMGVLTIVAVTTITPFLWTLSMSLKSEEAVFQKDLVPTSRETFAQVEGEEVRVRVLRTLEDGTTVRVKVLSASADERRIVDIAMDLGFSSHSHFSAAFRRHFSATPSALRRPPAGG